MIGGASIVPEATRRPADRLGLRSALGAAFVVTLIRPGSWAFGLAGFLAGGGLVVVAWPILVLPTPTGLQNALGGPLNALVLGAPSVSRLLVIAAALAAVLAVLGLGLLIGAWAERQGIAVALEVAADEGLIPAGRGLAGAPGAGRIALVRALGLVPVAVVAAASWPPLYDAAYRELVLPADLVTPLPIRVIGDVPWLVAAIGVAWLLCDSAAAVGVRRLVLEDRHALAAWLLGWADLVRRPHRILATALAGTSVLVLILGPALLASAIGWARVRSLILDGREPLGAVAAVAIWVAMWLGALVLAGVAAAFRTAAWTFELPRR